MPKNKRKIDDKINIADKTTAWIENALWNMNMSSGSFVGLVQNVFRTYTAFVYFELEMFPCVFSFAFVDFMHWLLL
jgi:hypothetical protein